MVEQIWMARSWVQAALALGEPLQVFEARADATALRLEGLGLPNSPAGRRVSSVFLDT